MLDTAVGTTFDTSNDTIISDITSQDYIATDDYVLFPEVGFFVKAIAQPVIFSSGILSNALTFITLCRMKMGPTCKTVITALCVSDFFACVFGLEYVVLFCLLTDGVETKLGHYSVALVTVLAMQYVYLFWLCLSATITMLISILRTYLLKYPLKAVRKFTPYRVRIVLFTLFGILFLLFLPVPLLILWQSCYEDQETEICQSFVKVHKHWLKNVELYFYALAVVFGPICTIGSIFFWNKMKGLLKGSLKKSVGMQQRLLESPEAQKQEQRTMRVTKMFVFVLLFNLVCTTALSVHIMAAFTAKVLNYSQGEEAARRSCTFGDVTRTLASVLLSLVPCSNFWVYLVLNSDFQNEVKSILGICPTERQQVNSMRSTTTLHTQV